MCLFRFQLFCIQVSISVVLLNYHYNIEVTISYRINWSGMCGTTYMIRAIIGTMVVLRFIETVLNWVVDDENDDKQFYFQ